MRPDNYIKITSYRDADKRAPTDIIIAFDSASAVGVQVALAEARSLRPRDAYSMSVWAPCAGIPEGTPVIGESMGADRD